MRKFIILACTATGVFLAPVAVFAEMDSAYTGGGRTTTADTEFCHQVNDGFGCEAGNDGGGATRFWMTFTGPALTEPSATLTMPGASECEGTSTFDVYVVNKTMVGNENATWNQYDNAGNQNWGNPGGDYEGGAIGSGTCSNSEFTVELTFDAAQETAFTTYLTLGFIGTGGGAGNYALWYAASIFNSGGATLSFNTAPIPQWGEIYEPYLPEISMTSSNIATGDLWSSRVENILATSTQRFPMCIAMSAWAMFDEVFATLSASASSSGSITINSHLGGSSSATLTIDLAPGMEDLLEHTEIETIIDWLQGFALAAAWLGFGWLIWKEGGGKPTASL